MASQWEANFDRLINIERYLLCGIEEVLVSKLQPMGQMWPVDLCKYRLLEHTPVHLCVDCGCFCVTTAELSSCLGNHIALRAYTTYCLALHKKSLLTSGLRKHLYPNRKWAENIGTKVSRCPGTCTQFNALPTPSLNS